MIVRLVLASLQAFKLLLTAVMSRAESRVATPLVFASVLHLRIVQIEITKVVQVAHRLLLLDGSVVCVRQQRVYDGSLVARLSNLFCFVTD